MPSWQDAPIVGDQDRPRVAKAPDHTDFQSTADWWTKNAGVPRHVAEGIADDVGGESSFRLTVPGDSGTSIALYQAHGDRKSSLTAMPGWDVDPNVQHQWALSQVHGGDKIATEHWEEIKNSKTREEAREKFKKYFLRPASNWNDAPVVGSGKWNIANSAIAYEQGRNNSNVVWMSPDDYLGLASPVEADSDNRTKRRSLMKSLDLGDDIEAIPTLDVKPQKGRAKVYDQDGRNRAMVAKEEGVDLIPVAIHGGTGDFKEIEGMTGNVMPFEFKPVPVVPRETTPQSVGRAIAAPVERVIGEVGRGIARGFGDEPIGPSDENVKGLRESGLFSGPFGRLSEAAYRAAEPAVETVGRGVSAGLGGLAGGVAQTAREFGEDPGMASRLERDIYQGGQAALTLGGALPWMPKVAEARPAAAPGASAGLPPSSNPYSVAQWAVNQAAGPAAAPGAAGASPAGAAAGAVGPGAQNMLARIRDQTLLENRAKNILNRRFAEGVRSGEVNPATASAELVRGRAEGLPVTLADVGGSGIQSLVGSVARQGGPARGRVAQWAVNRLADVDRDSPLTTNIEEGISKYLATGSARTEAKALAEQRAAGKPKWDKAMAGGSIAPLRTQIERAWSDLSRQEVELKTASRQAEQAANDPEFALRLYGPKATKADLASKADAARQNLLEVQRAKADIKNLRDRAVADGTANAPGAVWSPHLEYLMSRPNVRRGINRGWEMEGDEAAGQNRPLNAMEFSIIGREANGDPIVGAVPNMKLLAVAKEGLDAMLDSPEFKEELTGRLNKGGRSLKILRDGLVNELDNLNPDYKPARDQWAGNSAVIGALRDGKKFHQQTPEEIAEWFNDASESEKKAYRIGAADTMRDDLDRAVLGGDPTKTIVNSRGARNRILPMFKDPKDADDFLSRVKTARRMFQTPADILRGSPTAARSAEDIANARGLEEVANALHGVVSAASGHPAGIGAALLRGAKWYANPADLALNDMIAKLAIDPTLQLQTGPGMNLLRSIPLPRTQNALQRGLGRIAPQQPFPMTGLFPQP